MAKIVKMKKIYVPVFKESETFEWEDMWGKSGLYVRPHEQVIKDDSFESVGVLEIGKKFIKKDMCSFAYGPFGGKYSKDYWANVTIGYDKEFIPGKHILVLFNGKQRSNVYFGRKSTFITDYTEEVDGTDKTEEFLNNFEKRMAEKGKIDECLEIFKMAGTSLENTKTYTRIPSCFIGLKLDNTYSVSHRYEVIDPFDGNEMCKETQRGNPGNYVVQWLDNELDLHLGNLYVFDELPSQAREIRDIEMLKQVKGLSQKVLERGNNFLMKGRA